MRFLSWRAAGIVLAVMLVLGPSAASARTNHALIVAVNDYPNLPEKYNLRGPNNDARLIREFLTGDAAPVRFDPADVTVLAEGIEAQGEPTLAGIEAAFAALTERVGEGDFVYLHFSGHGAQQPALDPAIEPDGLDEIFLPSDAGMWEGATGGVPSALVDNRIGELLAGIRRKGAFVWVVFDSCHSATVTREAVASAQADVQERKVEPGDLGISEAAIAEAVARARAIHGTTRGVGEGQRSLARHVGERMGGMVAFFAAQTVETTPEMPLPQDVPDSPRLGLFTYTLMSQLALNPRMTYRQLAHNIQQAYAAANRTRPTPLVEGDLDAPVFGMEPGDRVLEWPITVRGGSAVIPAGSLHRLAPGMKLAILASPAATDEEALGYLEIVATETFESTLLPVAHQGLPSLRVNALPPQAIARVTETVVDFRMTVARPDPAGGDLRAIAIVNETLDVVVGAADAPFRYTIVEPGEPADVVLGVFAETDVPGGRIGRRGEPRLWFLPSSGEIGPELFYFEEADEDAGADPSVLSLRMAGSLSRGLRLPDADPGDSSRFAEQMRRNLTAIYRATNLSRIDARSEFRPSEVDARLEVQRADSGAMEPLAAGETPVLHPGDLIHLFMENRMGRPVDVNILYIGSDYTIGAYPPERFQPNDRLSFPLFEITPESFGKQRLVLALREAGPGQPVEDLTFLAQAGLLLTRSAGAQTDLSALLEDLGGGAATRSMKVVGRQQTQRSAISTFFIETAPRD